VEHGVIASNKADGYGGGIYNDIGSGLVISGSSIFSNQADYDLNGNGGGGGVYNLSEMDVNLQYVAITGNYSGHAPGGGFYSSNSGGDSVIIQDCIFGSNITNSYGGNIVHASDGVFEVYRSEVYSGIADTGAGFYSSGYSYLESITFSDNTATGNGGAIYIGLGEAEIIHNTIAENTGEMGAGIYSAGDAHIKSTILSNNRTAAGSLTNCVSSYPPTNITSLGYNITDGSSCAPPMLGDLPHTDPRLGSHAHHGGTNKTWTYALQLASPAIDAADPAGGPLLDQRGISRPQPVGGVRDIGAYESNVDRWFLPMIMK
jgi:predicted outer membrane repeat protein